MEVSILRRCYPALLLCALAIAPRLSAQVVLTAPDYRVKDDWMQLHLAVLEACNTGNSAVFSGSPSAWPLSLSVPVDASGLVVPKYPVSVVASVGGEGLFDGSFSYAMPSGSLFNGDVYGMLTTQGTTAMAEAQLTRLYGEATAFQLRYIHDQLNWSNRVQLMTFGAIVGGFIWSRVRFL